MPSVPNSGPVQAGRTAKSSGSPAPRSALKPPPLPGGFDGPPVTGSASDDRPGPPLRNPELDLHEELREDSDASGALPTPLGRPTSIPPGGPQPIAKFARFELLGRLAIGGMAEIFLARESLEVASSASRYTAIKIIRGEYAEDGDFANMFFDEGRLAMRLSHPNICTVYECGRHDGRFFMAMEFVHGQTLREVLVRAAKNKRPMPIPVLLKIFGIIAEALDFAHRAKDAGGRPLKIVHRDVSPHNVMVRYDGVVKLLDFGVAKAERSTHATETGALKGKFGYMSPEQAMSEPVDARADIFSLGVCIFEGVTGRRLFHRKAQYDTLKAILEQDPPPLSAFRDDVPEGLEAIVEKALAKDRDVRYQRAADLAHDLERLLTEMREVVGTARIAAVMEELFAEEMESGPPLDTADDIRERFAELSAPGYSGTNASGRESASNGARFGTRTWRWMAVAGGVALLLAGAGGGWAWLSRGDDRTTAESERVTDEAIEPVPNRTDHRTASVPSAPGPRATGDVAHEAGDDATLAGSAEEAAATADQDESGNAADEPQEEASSASTRSAQERSRSRRERARREQRRGTGTVIVTDPGF